MENYYSNTEHHMLMMNLNIRNLYKIIYLKLYKNIKIKKMKKIKIVEIINYNNSKKSNDL